MFLKIFLIPKTVIKVQFDLLTPSFYDRTGEKVSEMQLSASVTYLGSRRTRKNATCEVQRDIIVEADSDYMKPSDRQNGLIGWAAMVGGRDEEGNLQSGLKG